MSGTDFTSDQNSAGEDANRIAGDVGQTLAHQGEKAAARKLVEDVLKERDTLKASSSSNDTFQAKYKQCLDQIATTMTANGTLPEVSIGFGEDYFEYVKQKGDAITIQSLGQLEQHYAGFDGSLPNMLGFALTDSLRRQYGAIDFDINSPANKGITLDELAVRVQGLRQSARPDDTKVDQNNSAAGNDAPNKQSGTEDVPNNHAGTEDVPNNHAGTKDVPNNHAGTEDVPNNHAGTKDAPKIQSETNDAAPALWDQRLTGMHAGFEPAQGLQPGEKYWKLVSAKYLPADGNWPTGSEGRHHVYYHVLDQQGRPIANASIALNGDPGATKNNDPVDGDMGNMPMDASYDPGKGAKGAYTAAVTAYGYPSDKVDGMGLPLKRHVSYDLTWKLSTWAGDATQDAGPAESAGQSNNEYAGRPGSQNGLHADPLEDGIQHTLTHDHPELHANFHPDLNLDLRGYTQLPGNPDHTIYGIGAQLDQDGLFSNLAGHQDKLTPKIDTIFTKERLADPSLSTADGMPILSSYWQVGTWNWDNSHRNLKDVLPGHKGPPVTDNPNDHSSPVSMVGFKTKQGEPIFIPDSGYTVQGQGATRMQAQVLYVGKDSITLNYTLNGDVHDGYTWTVKGIKIDPSVHEGMLVGRQQPIGVAEGDEMFVAMRDKGTFMDIRARQFWWTH